MRGAKNLSQSMPPEVEDRTKVAIHKESVNETTTENGIVDAVFDKRAAVLLLKPVFVDPRPIGSLPLPIYESIGRIPSGDFTLPTEWQAAKS